MNDSTIYYSKLYIPSTLNTDPYLLASPDCASSKISNHGLNDFLVCLCVRANLPFCICPNGSSFSMCIVLGVYNFDHRTDIHADPITGSDRNKLDLQIS